MGITIARDEVAPRDYDESRDSPQGGSPVTGARADTPTQAKSRTRDLRLDLFRGIALFLIFIDHIPGNVLSRFTLQSIGFSDAAEIFIYISGYTAALVYGRRMLERGMFITTVKIAHRVWQLYVAHIFILVIFTALVAYNSLAFDQTAYGKALRATKFFTEPYIAVIRALELRFQPAFLDILPLYIVLLAAFPLVLLLLRRNSLAALVPSLGIYVGAYGFGLSLHGYPGNHAWFFNPLAWQLLFVIAAACGYIGVTGRKIPAAPPWLVGLALMILLGSAVVRLSWTVHGLWEAIPAILITQLWPIDKTDLAPIRLAHFLALAIVVVRFMPADAKFLRSRLAQPIIRCGQQSLQVFCLGILLSVVGYFLFTEWSDSLTVQLAVNIAGVAMMIGAGALISWYRTIDSDKAAAAGRHGYRIERSQDTPCSPLPRDAGRRVSPLMLRYTAISDRVFGGIGRTYGRSLLK
jgi:hypothetical protein